LLSLPALLCELAATETNGITEFGIDQRAYFVVS
jgi:hypothetical protein